MMPEFNVLDEHLNIHQNYLLEASAGTGKTFSIENIVARLLIEDHPLRGTPLKIQELLVVTFTRAATRDLIARIRQTIVSAIERLEEDSIPPGHYLSKVALRGKEAVEAARRSLEDALFCFDQAQIYTIHEFCSKMLREHVFEGNMSLEASFSNGLSILDIQAAIKNVIRSEVSRDKYCAEQIEILLSSSRGQYEQLERDLIKLVQKEAEIAEENTFTQDYKAFLESLDQLKKRCLLDGDLVWEDYENQKPLYTKPSANADAAVRHFCCCIDKESLSEKDFAKLIGEGLAIVEALHPDKLRKKPPKLDPAPVIHYPELVPLLQESLLPIISRARSADVILARLARECKQHLKNYCAQEEKLNFNDLLQHMRSAIGNPSFKKQVHHKYGAAIIDEFQDTDPLQWDIFRELFLEKEGCLLYLVGDPKQAIYSFRQADIYTYLSAAEAIGSDCIASLDTNYRSSPPLIDALNTLFSKETAANLIPLPRLGSSLPYHPVKAGKTEPAPDFKDTLAAVTFCTAKVELKRSNSFPLDQMERDTFFPHIAEEIEKILQTTTIPLCNIAILICDRHQAERLSCFLREREIAYVLRRTIPLSESPALNALRELLIAAIDPKDQSAVKTALGGQMIRYTHKDLLNCCEGASLEKILETFYLLRKELFEKGFSSFYESVLRSSWQAKEGSLLENILSSSDGLEFYDDLQQIAEILMEHQSKANPSPDGLVAYLDAFDEMAVNEESQVKKRRDPGSDAVNIITLHSSKGLEYDVVYALGAIKRGSPPSMIVPVPADKGRILKAIIDKEDPDYQGYCREIDAEKMRLLYVAMTRAKYRLYIPVVYIEKSKVDYGCASPMDLYLSKAMAPDDCSYEEMYQRIQSPDLSILQGIAARHPHISLIELPKKKMQPAREAGKKNSPTLEPPKSIAIPGCDLFMQSFSSLTRTHAASAAHDTPAPADFLAEEKNPFTLPSGSETGNLLHLVLETLDFQQSGIEEHVLRYTRGTKYEPWTKAIEMIMNNVLKVSIDGFCLKDIPREMTYREMEFIYPVSGQVPYIEDFEYLPGYLKGVIDLVLKANDRYYIVDWKSNWLGGSLDDYAIPQLKASVIDHRYYLQAALYGDALKKYLALVDPRPFEEIFGGAYYLYLRGLSTSRGDTGIIPLHKGFLK